MAAATGYSTGRVLQAWIIALLACGSFLVAVHHFAPVVLQHDRNTSVWYLTSLADENWDQYQSLSRDGDTGKKKELLEKAAGYLKQVRQIRPDSNYYLWFQTLVLRALAKLDNPPNQVLEAESLCLIQQLWERPDGRSEKTARYFADYYLTHGKIEQASPFVRFLLDLDPGDSLAYDGLVQASIKAGDIKAAIQTLERKAQSTHLTPDDRHLLAVLAIQSGDYRKAASYLETVLGRGVETKERWFLYGLALLGQKDTESAQRAFGVYKYAMGGDVALPESPTLGLREFPPDVLPILPQAYQSARPAKEGVR